MSELENYLDRGRRMTVGQLKHLLEQFHEDELVMLGHTASDYWRTPVAHHVGDVDLAAVKYTAYHGCGEVLDEDCSHDEDGEETRRVVLINC
jgi:hypothetical protein